MKLTELRKDNRVLEINKVYGEDFNYEIWLKDGYVFDDGLNSGYEVANTVNEINALMGMVKEA